MILGVVFGIKLLNKKEVFYNGKNCKLSGKSRYT